MTIEMWMGSPRYSTKYGWNRASQVPQLTWLWVGRTKGLYPGNWTSSNAMGGCRLATELRCSDNYTSSYRINMGDKIFLPYYRTVREFDNENSSSVEEQTHVTCFSTNPFEMPTEQWKQCACVGQKKSCSWWTNKQPIAFSVLIWFWSTYQNWFSSTNGRENGSSVYRQTRLGQL